MHRLNGPTVLVLSRQNLPILDQTLFGNARGLEKGAYILAKEKGSKPDAILIATGSEVQIALQAREELEKKQMDVRVVSMPSWELFREQSADYRNSILPSDVTKRLAIEAGSSMGWLEWVGEKGVVLGIDHFGVSAPYQTIYKEFGLSAENIVKKLSD
jgi:transketolase